MLDNIDESNNNIIITTSSMLLIFSLTAVFSYPTFVLEVIHIDVAQFSSSSSGEVPGNSSSSEAIFSSASSSGTLDDFSGTSVANTFAKTALLTGCILFGYILVAFFLIGNRRNSSRISRIIRVVVGLAFSSFCTLVFYFVVVTYFEYDLPFYKGFKYFLVANSGAVALGYVYVLVGEFAWPNFDFRKKRYENLVRRLLLVSKERRQYKQTGVPPKSSSDSDNNHKPFEEMLDVFYPQRLIFSTFICAFAIVALACLVAANLLQFSKYYLPVVWEIMSLPKNTLEIIQHVFSRASCAAFLPILNFAWCWFFMFKNYRAKIFRMRQGKYDFDKKLGMVYNAPKYLGRQLFVSIIAYFVLATIFAIFAVIIVLSVFVPTIRHITIMHTIQLAALWVGSYLARKFSNWWQQKIFLKQGILRFKPLFIANDYVVGIAYLVTGFMDAIRRLTSTCINLCIYYPRMDIPAYPNDPAYASFVSVLCVDHQYNNPILRVFVDMLLSVHTGRPSLDSDLIGSSPMTQHSPPSSPILPTSLPPSPISLTSSSLLSFADISPHATVRAGPLRSSEFVRARNRWQLARTLCANPSLIKLRKHWLGTM
eukprot:Phypoly_transcript_05143.p1 GENE.Phypoly_transcript_05143~~Phypoly_transcript_05143.p1  ORF type:complete len:595 (+),score=87.55 Phypoly_transcript_05143:205-1989(+)